VEKRGRESFRDIGEEARNLVWAGKAEIKSQKKEGDTEGEGVLYRKKSSTFGRKKKEKSEGQLEKFGVGEEKRGGGKEPNQGKEKELTSHL